MDDLYSFTDAGLARLALAGVPPAVVWSAVHSRQHLMRHVDDTTAVLMAVAGTGEYVAVALEESTHQDNDWDITGARFLDGDEIEAFDRIRRQQP